MQRAHELRAGPEGREPSCATVGHRRRGLGRFWPGRLAMLGAFPGGTATSMAVAPLLDPSCGVAIHSVRTRALVTGGRPRGAQACKRLRNVGGPPAALRPCPLASGKPRGITEGGGGTEEIPSLQPSATDLSIPSAHTRTHLLRSP